MSTVTEDSPIESNPQAEHSVVESQKAPAVDVEEGWTSLENGGNDPAEDTQHDSSFKAEDEEIVMSEHLTPALERKDQSEEHQAPSNGVPYESIIPAVDPHQPTNQSALHIGHDDDIARQLKDSQARIAELERALKEKSDLVAMQSEQIERLSHKHHENPTTDGDAAASKEKIQKPKKPAAVHSSPAKHAKSTAPAAKAAAASSSTNAGAKKAQTPAVAKVSTPTKPATAKTTKTATPKASSSAKPTSDSTAASSSSATAASTAASGNSAAATKPAHAKPSHAKTSTSTTSGESTAKATASKPAGHANSATKPGTSKSASSTPIKPKHTAGATKASTPHKLTSGGDNKVAGGAKKASPANEGKPHASPAHAKHTHAKATASASTTTESSSSSIDNPATTAIEASNTAAVTTQQIEKEVQNILI